MDQKLLAKNAKPPEESGYENLCGDLRRDGRCAGTEAKPKLKIDEAGYLRLRRHAAGQGDRERQYSGGAGCRQQRREVQAILTEIVDAELRWLRRMGAQFGLVRIGMRHRPDLGEEKRQRRNQRNAKFLGVIQSSQAKTLKRSPGS
jgi:hypothetical protein